MNKLKISLLALAIGAGLTSMANAVPIVTQIGTGDVPKNGTGIGGGNSNNAENNFFRLETFLSTNPADCTPIFEGAFRSEGNGANLNVDVTGFSFAVIHFGAGKGGTKGSGGGVAFYSISGDGTFSFPNNGSGPNGKGGFSSLDLFQCEHNNNVPDGGTTAMLLGSALTGLGIVRRFVKS